jgi:hypothetical protein
MKQWGFFLLVFLLAGCQPIDVEVDDPITTEPTEAQVEIRLAQVGRFTQDTNGYLSGSEFVEFYVDRVDLDLYEPDNSTDELFLYDLDDAQQIAHLNLKLSETDEGTLCEKNAFPHQCIATGPGSYLVAIEFEDGGTALVPLEVPEVPEAAPTSIMSPDVLPGQESTFELSFLDTGAYHYAVHVELCDLYKGDGINPCLNDTSFHVYQADSVDGECEYEMCMDSENLVLTYSSYEPYPPIFQVEEGVISLWSDLPLIFQDLVHYRVCAYHQADLADAVTYFEESCTVIEFEQ